MPPRISTPFVGDTFDPMPGARRMGDLLRYGAQNAGEYEMERGRIAANLGSNLANIAGQTISGITQYYADEKKAQPARDAMARENAIRDVTKLVPPDAKTGRPDLKKMAEEIQRIDPIKALEFYQAADAQEKAKMGVEAQRTDQLARSIMTFEADSRKLAPPERQAMYTAVREELIAGGLADAETVPEKYSPAFVSRMRGVIEPLDSLFKRMAEAGGEQGGFTLGANDVRFERQPDGTMKEVARGMTPPVKTPEPPTVGSFEDFVTTKFGARPTAEQITAARKEYNQADDRPININTGGGQRPLTQTAEAGIIQRLTTQWDRVATPVRELDRQVGIMDVSLQAARRGDLNQGSQAIIMTFNKVLDSLSVVREGEFLRTTQGQSMVNRIRGAIEKLSVGGAGVPIGELEKFAQLAREMATEQKKFLPSMQERIGKTADRYNIPRELIFEDMGSPAAAGVAPPPGGGATPAATPAKKRNPFIK